MPLKVIDSKACIKIERDNKPILICDFDSELVATTIMEVKKKEPTLKDIFEVVIGSLACIIMLVFALIIWKEWRKR